MENNEVRNKATNKEILEMIEKYKNIIYEYPFTPVRLEATLNRIYMLRNLLYNKNKDSNKDIIIKEAVNFVKFQEDLLVCGLSKREFARTIRLMFADYVKLSRIDESNLLFNQCEKTLNKVRDGFMHSGLLVRGIDKYITSINEIKNRKEIAKSF